MIDDIKVRRNEVEKKDQQICKSKKLFKYKKIIGLSDFFIPRTRLLFTILR